MAAVLDQHGTFLPQLLEDGRRQVLGVSKVGHASAELVDTGRRETPCLRMCTIAELLCAERAELGHCEIEGFGGRHVR